MIKKKMGSPVGSRLGFHYLTYDCFGVEFTNELQPYRVAQVYTEAA
jgi:hypothetical protein